MKSKSSLKPVAKICLTAACVVLSVLGLSLVGGKFNAALADYGSCSASTTNISFGTQNVSTLASSTTTGTATYSCPANVNGYTAWAMCPSIGAGTNSVSQANRTMTNGSNSISYQLYVDSGYSTLFQYPGSDVVHITYVESTGSSWNTTIYAKILSAASNLPPGTYTDTYTTSSQAAIASDSTPTYTAANECTGNSGAHFYSTLNFTVSVIVSPSCSITAGSVNFGTAGLLTNTVDASGTISVTCTSTTPYNILLGNGQNYQGGFEGKRGMALNGATILYNLWQDSARSSYWGSTVGTDTVAGTGTGSAQPYTVYGRVYGSQTTPATGTYTDTVVVTVSY